MKSRSSFGFFAVVAALVVASGLGLSSQWQKTTQLRGELEQVRFERDEVARLRAENQRLHARQIPAIELEALRADHAALPRLRAELEALQPRPPATGR